MIIVPPRCYERPVGDTGPMSRRRRKSMRDTICPWRPGGSLESQQHGDDDHGDDDHLEGRAWLGRRMRRRRPCSWFMVAILYFVRSWELVEAML